MVRLMVKNATDCVGETALVKLNCITKDLPAEIAVKLEYLNPTCSVKDRAAKSMIDTAEEAGLITPGKSCIIEGTSGNLGISVAAICAMKGYKCVIVMNSAQSLERRVVLQSLGAVLVLTDPALGFDGVEDAVDRIAEIVPHSFKTSQFTNPANPLAHYKATGPEIWAQTEGKVDMVIFGIGSGGTVTGTGRYLKEQNPNIEVYGAEPFESSVLNGFPKGIHKIQGIGAGMIPVILDRSILSEVLRVKSDDAIAMARRLVTEEGIMGGISSGANVWAAVELAKRPENKGKLIVTTVNSYGERYLSTDLFKETKEEVSTLTHMDIPEQLDVVKKAFGL